MPKISDRKCPVDLCGGMLVTRFDTIKGITFKRCTKCDHTKDTEPMSETSKNYLSFYYKYREAK